MKVSDSRLQERLYKKVVELRFEPLVSALDNRSKVIHALMSSLGEKSFPFWKSENNTTIVTNTRETPSRVIQFDKSRLIIVCEDEISLSSFREECIKIVQIVQHIYKDELKLIERIGCRFLTVYSDDKLESYNDCLENVNTKYFNNNLPLSLPVVDSRATIHFENIHCNIGPIKKGEDWIKNYFTKPDENCPEFGYGIDVDAFLNGAELSDEHSVSKHLKMVFDLLSVVSKEIIESFEA